MKVVILSRVSTSLQDNQRQIVELTEYSNQRGWTILKVFEEKISGSKTNEERPVLTNLIKFVKDNEIDKVLTWELSRIGRNSLEVLKTIEIFNQNKISLYIHNHKIETLNEDGETNPMTTFLIQILTSVSQMERTTIRQRIKSGYDNFRKSGGIVGRKEGYRKSIDTILEENKDVVKLLKQGYSVRKVMKLTDRSSGLVQKVKKSLSSPSS
jgi:DNA invertase Pin-like site-specific DNA recombinase